MSDIKCAVNDCSTAIDDIIEVTDCKHMACKLCLSKTLVACRAWRDDPISLYQPTIKAGKRLSLFHFPPFPELPVSQKFSPLCYPPILREIRCPVQGCDRILHNKDVSFLSEFTIDWIQTKNEYQQMVASMRLWPTCCLNGVVCEDGPQPVIHFVQLSCMHYFHPACLAPAIRTSIDTQRRSNKPSDIACPKCVEQGAICLCTDCNGETPHVLTDGEIRGLVDSQECDFTEQHHQQWTEVMFAAFMHRENMREDKNEQFVVCRCGLSFCTDVRNSIVNCPCGFRMCILCKKDVHEGTCEEARQMEIMASWKTSGMDLIQLCPHCGAQWDRPLDCMHVTCETGIFKGGCGQQFCFLCAAPWTPIICHSNAYHRTGCDLREDCCDKKCIPNGSQVCVTDKYWPGPCHACRNVIARHNTCSHTQWQACHSCRNLNKNCNHWCRECNVLGRLCIPPVNPYVMETATKTAHPFTIQSTNVIEEDQDDMDADDTEEGDNWGEEVEYIAACIQAAERGDIKRKYHIIKYADIQKADDK